MNRSSTFKVCFLATLALLVSAAQLLGVPAKKKKTPAAKASTSKTASKRTVASKATSSKRSASKSTVRAKASVKRRKVRQGMTGRNSMVAGGPWKEPTFADSALGDVIDGEDLTIRQAAVNALGPYNGSIVVVDPSTGRILTIVNQRLALRSGYQPCSTIKLVCALAGLHEGVIERDTLMRIGRRHTLDLTAALAISNNYYFAKVGEKLGFEKVREYSQLFGLGEKAGLDIEGEYPGILPDAPPKFGGVGMMMSFGEGIQLTTLQLASLVSAIANGGTLYHLQYPRSADDVKTFTPKVKRHLDIADDIPEIRPGMMGAVEHGTARRAFYDPNEPILGKTGTCTDRATPTHLGWFGSYNEVAGRKLAVVVLLTGGKAVNGSVAAQVAGSVYRNLSSENYFKQQSAGVFAETASIETNP